MSPDPVARFERLTPTFFEAPVVTLARRLLGKVLVHETRDGLAAGRIVETEAYRGPDDLAAHSSRGRRTKRTEAMFGPPGRAYVFLLYGTSSAFNVVAGKEGDPHAILVRALEPMHGHDLMAKRRNMEATRRELTNGPGKLAAALGIDRAHYGADLVNGTLYLADGPRVRSIGVSRRINIDYAGAWIEKPWRFYERGNAYVSVKPRD